MTRRLVTANLLLLATTALVFAAEILKIEDPKGELAAAREAKTNLLGSDNGFEASGAGELSEIRLPVVGALPSELGAIFAPAGTGFEATPKVPANFRESGLKTVPGSTLNKLEYSISYQHILDGLDAVCVGTRLTNRRSFKQPPDLRGGPNGQALTGGDELRVAHAAQTRYGLPYRCDVHCSDVKTNAYCRNNDYAQRMLDRALLLAPGKPD